MSGCLSDLRSNVIQVGTYRLSFYRPFLQEDLKDDLANRDETSSLEKLFSPAIHLDNRLHQRHRERLGRRGSSCRLAIAPSSILVWCPLHQPTRPRQLPPLLQPPINLSNWARLMKILSVCYDLFQSCSALGHALLWILSLATHPPKVQQSLSPSLFGSPNLSTLSVSPRYPPPWKQRPSSSTMCTISMASWKITSLTEVSSSPSKYGIPSASLLGTSVSLSSSFHSQSKSQ